MPYIPQDRREKFEAGIQQIVDYLGWNNEKFDMNDAKGEMNYVIFSIVSGFLGQFSTRYHNLQDFIGGTMTSCQQELYRRLVDPYEDKAILKNGDALRPADNNYSGENCRQDLLSECPCVEPIQVP